MLKKTTLSLALVLAGALSGTAALANQPAASAATKTPSKPAPKPAAKHAAKPAAKAAATTAATGAAVLVLTSGQLDAAQRVFTGKASCEFGEQIDVTAVDGKPGHFHLKHKSATYHLVPEETTTGAVRLEDKGAGIVWLQIPSKSMLMNAKIGQRLVDECLMTQQRS